MRTRSRASQRFQRFAVRCDTCDVRRPVTGQRKTTPDATPLASDPRQVTLQILFLLLVAYGADLCQSCAGMAGLIGRDPSLANRRHQGPNLRLEVTFNIRAA
ncbi:hypothetical protein RRG08_058982 [Elysia crispata]|uniref:Uncharacterized protein n=1 Tax=Elysia crispata TaxID=231223 RepID=A0AAE1AX84_9GAST|nr:hypothetical protein RRG08_058982 [Elysia crispata]